ncbi:FIST signal transduction protein [Solibacillus sp. NPDC093137]|uniref:FIST signal transduction protein n=1 Tax=Solibacillus sp. NPDC093137 TaxID=3390678 RepID=UPI003D02AA75
MDFIRTGLAKSKQPEKAVEELTNCLHKEPRLLLYFASAAYDFKQLSQLFSQQYPNAQIVGVTTTGEIGPQGFSEFSISAQSYAEEFGKVEAVLMTDIVKYPIFDRQKLVHAAKKVGIQVNAKAVEKEGLAFVFPVGLQAGEEKMLSVVNSIFTEDRFPIFGGTAGDDAKFEKTYVSVNGETSSIGGAVIFIKPNVDFYIYKENTFKSTGKKVKITKANAEKRIVYEMDGRPAAEVYANAIGVKRTELEKHWSLYPLGRKFNQDFYNASPFKVLANGATEFYCQVYEGAILEVLEPKDAVMEMEKTIRQFTEHFTELNGVLTCNCILRKLQFQDEKLFPKLNEQLKQLPHLCGFSSYGEQLNKSQLNQTMLLIGFGKLRAE